MSDEQGKCKEQIEKAMETYAKVCTEVLRTTQQTGVFCQLVSIIGVAALFAVLLVAVGFGGEVPASLLICVAIAGGVLGVTGLVLHHCEVASKAKLAGRCLNRLDDFLGEVLPKYVGWAKDADFDDVKRVIQLLGQIAADTTAIADGLPPPNAN